MSFKVATKGTRPTENKIFISKISKTVTFSVGFFRTNNINPTTPYVRLAYNAITKEIAFAFSNNKTGDMNEYLKLSPTLAKTSASCSVNPILNTFNLTIDRISGSYAESAISGPAKIPNFSDNGFILDTKMRKV